MLHHSARARVSSRESRHHPHPIGFQEHRYDALDLDEFGSCDDGAFFWLQKHRCEPLERAGRQRLARQALIRGVSAPTWLLSFVAGSVAAARRWVKTRIEPLEAS